MSMAAKPEEQADSEEEKKRAAEEEEEGEAAIKRREQAEAEFDSLVYDKPNMSESEKAAEAEEREKNRKMREEFSAEMRSAYKRHSAEAPPLTWSERCRVRQADRCAAAESQMKREKEFQEAQADYDALFGAEWDEFLLTGEMKSEPISDSAAPRQQKRPRCFAC